MLVFNNPGSYSNGQGISEDTKRREPMKSMLEL